MYNLSAATSRRNNRKCIADDAFRRLKIKKSYLGQPRCDHLTGRSPTRIVVTGIGAITPLGKTFPDSWRALLRYESGLKPLTEVLRYQHDDDEKYQRDLDLMEGLPCHVAAGIPPEFLSMPWNRRTTTRSVAFALQAGQEAFHAAQLPRWLGFSDDSPESDSKSSCRNNEDPTFLQRRRCTGVCVGSGMSSVREVYEAYETLSKHGGYRKISPHFVPKVLPNSASGRLSIEYGLQGPNHTASTACAAGSHAISDAARFILNGDADIMLAGGTEASIDPLSVAGFCRLRALSPTANTATPSKASRPFALDRDGFVIGEGAAVLVLEEYDHAVARCAPIIAELIGTGASGDANHITSPDPQGRGAIRAMQSALQSAARAAVDAQTEVDVETKSDIYHRSYERIRRSVSYVNAHATSTPLGDDIEAHAIRETFGSEVTDDDTCSSSASQLLVSSTKGATGHLLGAAGAIEAAFTVQALADQIVPANLNLSDQDLVALQNIVGDASCEQNHGIEKKRSIDFVRVSTSFHAPQTLEAALSNSFGFGGTNASLLFRRFSDS
jgi:3-oxoacyl-[acyl-carrier-protein] synthase II